MGQVTGRTTGREELPVVDRMMRAAETQLRRIASEVDADRGAMASLQGLADALPLTVDAKFHRWIRDRIRNVTEETDQGGRLYELRMLRRRLAHSRDELV